MVGVFKNRTGRRYYVCGHRGSLTRIDGTGACFAPHAHADRLEAQVWERVTSLLRDPVLLEQELARRREAGSPTREGIESELRQAKERLAAIPAEMDRLVEGYGKGLIPDELMQARMTALQNEKNGLSERVDALERELLRLDADARAEAGALEFARRVAEGIDALDDEGRQKLLRLVVREIVVYRERIVIRTVLPGGDPDGGGQDPDGQLRSHASRHAGLLCGVAPAGGLEAVPL
jgi:site-specific DNA recombinase